MAGTESAIPADDPRLARCGFAKLQVCCVLPASKTLVHPFARPSFELWLLIEICLGFNREVAFCEQSCCPETLLG